MSVSVNSGFNPPLDLDNVWCTWPSAWSIVDELGIGADSGIALFDIGHMGVDTDACLAYLKTTATWRKADSIFLVDRENMTALQQELALDSRIHLWDSAVHDHDRFHLYIPWFDWVNQADQALGLVNRLQDPIEHTPRYLFDCIMGQRRAHRDFLYQKIVTDLTLRSKILVNYWGQGHDYLPGTFCDQPSNLDVDTCKDIYLYSRIPIQENFFNLGLLLPYEIYNQSWFSLIVESRANNDRLITEKLVKPLLAGRVFVLFGAQHHLRDLKHLGFKTFSAFIDESYDEIEDCETRWAAAWQAVQELASRDPQQIWEQLRPIAIHNQQMARRINWWTSMTTQMRDIVHKYRMERSS